MTRVRSCAASLLLLLWISSPAFPQIGIGGEYSGQYLCRHGAVKVDLRIVEAADGGLTGTFTFVSDGSAAGSYRLRGTFNPPNRSFSLEPDGWIREAPGWTPTAVTGQYNEVTGRLNGRILAPGCSTFVAARTGGESLAVVRPPAPGPERSPNGGEASYVREFEYVDATMLDAGEALSDTSPIDRMVQWLDEQGYRCLATHRVNWIGNKGTAGGTQFRTKRYLIHCRANCEGLRYIQMGIHGQIQATRYHFGLSQPYPLLHVKSVDFSISDFKWEFTRPGSEIAPADVRRQRHDALPDIYVHTWSNSSTEEGPGCSLFDGISTVTRNHIEGVRKECTASPFGKARGPQFCQCVINAMVGARLPPEEFHFFVADNLDELARSNPAFGTRYKRCVH